MKILIIFLEQIVMTFLVAFLIMFPLLGRELGIVVFIVIVGIYLFAKNKLKQYLKKEIR